VVNLNLSFLISPFTYNEEVYVQKYKLLKNRFLSVHISDKADLLHQEIAQIDFSPLPHFHQYSLEEWKYTLDCFFKENNLSMDLITLEVPYFNMIKNPSIIYEGELLFIIESVLFAIIEKKAPEVLARIKNRKIKINCLYSTKSKNDKKIDCLKIKIRPTPESLLKTKLIIKEQLLINPSILFRLDGNQSFELEDLIFFVNQLELTFGSSLFNSIEYLEEPLKKYSDYFSFFYLHPYPQALDESMMAYSQHLEFLKNLPPSTTLILKPSLLGISKCFEIIAMEKETTHKIVISSSYETLLAMTPLFFLAADNPLSYHGLDTLKFLPKGSGNCSNNPFFLL
jgi:O-succinylbenzoate synthase